MDEYRTNEAGSGIEAFRREVVAVVLPGISIVASLLP